MKLEITLLSDGQMIVGPAEGYALSDEAAKRISEAVTAWVAGAEPVGVIRDATIIHDLRIPPMQEQLDRIEAKVDRLLDEEPKP